MSKNAHPSGGEPIDRAAGDAIRLAHRALERFPELVRRHKFIAGGAAISTSLIVLAGVAIARRMRDGQSAEEAVASVTEQEVQGLRTVEPEPPATNGDESRREGERAAGREPAAAASGAGVNGNRGARR